MFDANGMVAVVSEPIGEIVELQLDSETVEFRWGYPHHLGTTAYWVEQTRRRPEVTSYRLGDTFEQEVVACIVGGYGIPARIGLAAFAALRESGVFEGEPSREQIEEVLSGPIYVPERAKSVRYRFAKQRSERVAAVLERLRDEQPPADPELMREWLLTLPGVGPKTASWIVRNWTGSDTMAIIDIHLQRAGMAAGFFSDDWVLPRDYELFEQAFRGVGELVDVSLAALDACIWDQMQYLGPHQSVMLSNSAVGAAI